ncbi:MAG TPA: hypothetical protein VKZ99_05595 [Gammaproteobacteria bacterium]|nr:hypothetical protein [Gammaproteobacteria bacterium]
MKRMLLVPLLALACGSSSAAEVWRCTNQDFEAHCSADGCTVNDDAFTPMDVLVSREGYVFFCMYSGCWEGQGKVLQTGRHLSVHAEALEWTPDVNESGETAEGAILVDTQDLHALLSINGYAQPLACRVLEGET